MLSFWMEASHGLVPNDVCCSPRVFFYHKTERNPQMLHGEIPMACFSNHGFQRPLGEHQLAQPRLGSEVEEMLIAFRFYGHFNENP